MRAAERHFDGEAVEFYGGCVLAFAEVGVAGFAELADLCRALGVDGDGGRRCACGCFDVEKPTVEGVERAEFGS